MKWITGLLLLSLACGCRPNHTPHAMIPEQTLADMRTKAHRLMMAHSNDSVVWDDAEVFTNMILEVWGERNDIKCDILLTDANPTNHSYRVQRFHYLPGTEEITLEQGLGTMVE